MSAHANMSVQSCVRELTTTIDAYCSQLRNYWLSKRNSCSLLASFQELWVDIISYSWYSSNDDDDDDDKQADKRVNRGPGGECALHMVLCRRPATSCLPAFLSLYHYPTAFSVMCIQRRFWMFAGAGSVAVQRLLGQIGHFFCICSRSPCTTTNGGAGGFVCVCMSLPIPVTLLASFSHRFRRHYCHRHHFIPIVTEIVISLLFCVDTFPPYSPPCFSVQNVLSSFSAKQFSSINDQISVLSPRSFSRFPPLTPLYQCPSTHLLAHTNRLTFTHVLCLPK